MTDSSRTSKPLKWPLLGALAWAGLWATALLLLAAIAWRDGLHTCTRFTLQLHYWSFMAQVFAFHAGVAMAPIAVFAVATKRRRMLYVSIILFLIGAGPELLSVFPRGSRDEAGAVKIMSINLMYGQGDELALLNQIRREAPDVLLFQEWTERGAAGLRQELESLYPHRKETARTDAFGQAVFSRLPFAGQPREYPPIPGFAVPQIGVGVLVRNRAMRIENVHLLAPTGLSNFDDQRKTADTLARWVGDASRADRPDILMGDFNATSRTAILGVLLRAGMQDAQATAGWWRGSTWPRVGTLRFLPGIQLDHAMCGPRVECVGVRTGEDFGSDHRPVIALVRWRAAAGE